MNFKNGKTLRDEPSRIRLLAMRESVQSFINLPTCIVRASYFLFFSFGIIRSRFGIKPASSANSSAISAAISPGLIFWFFGVCGNELELFPPVLCSSLPIFKNSLPLVNATLICLGATVLFKESVMKSWNIENFVYNNNINSIIETK